MWKCSWCSVILLLLSLSEDGKAFVSSSTPYLSGRSSDITTTGRNNEKKLPHPTRVPFLGSRTCSSSSLLHQSTPTKEEISEDVGSETASASNGVKQYSSSPSSSDSLPVVSPSGTQILADSKDFIKPERDFRQYRCIKLKNNLKVLLVSTSEVDGAIDDNDTNNGDVDDSDDEGAASAHVEAASVHVQAGHMDDTIPGLAHFHEHMLFLGTKKYPNEDEYEGFLSKFGGYSNAYTDMEDTNYYFSVTTTEATTTVPSSTTEPIEMASEGLHGGLDRLSQFFIEPIFEESMVDRELKAIDSEYRNSKTSDTWRNFQLLKSSCNPLHPFSNFGCGNYETLTKNSTISPRQYLTQFWDAYYKTANLRLAVAGRAPLDALQRSVEETFGKLPHSEDFNRRAKTNPNSPLFPKENSQYNGVVAFGKEQLGKIKEVIPLLETRTVKLYFATPPMDDHVIKRTRTHRALCHLLGHESPGSLHCLLNEMGYLNALSSGIAIDTSDFSLFSLTLALTPKGMEHKDEVIDLAFQWVALIRETTTNQPHIMEKYHEELNQIAKNNFRFRENGDPVDFCSAASELMFDENQPPERLLVASSDPAEYDDVVAKAFADRLRPENSLLMVIDSGLKKEEGNADEWTTEPWYGAVYRTSDIPAEKMKQWEFPIEINNRLYLPEFNKYIPTDFSLRCDDDDEEVAGKGSSSLALSAEAEKKKQPTLLNEKPGIFRLWHKMDKYWRIPKAFLRVSIVSPKTYSSPRSMTLNRIFQRVLNDDLNSFVYDASLAGCSYRVSCIPTGYRISVKGFSEKLSFLLDTLTSRMLSLIVEMKQGKDASPALYAKFIKAKESLCRETKNYRLDTPYEVANYNSRLLLEENVWYLDNYIEEMEGEYAERDPLTMEECARVVEESLMGRVKAEILCMGNINEAGAKEVGKVIEDHFLKSGRPLSEVETPRFRSLKLPTRSEAIQIFGTDSDVQERVAPLIYQELAASDSEETNAIELIMQAGCGLDLGYEGIALLELISHMAYNSAYNQLRTKEQLGYIVSAFARKTAGGTWGLSVVVQSSVALPNQLEERVEAWLGKFYEELKEMDADDIVAEAYSVVSQLLERDTRLSQEVGRVWGDILNTEAFSDKLKMPIFDRLQRLADELTVVDDVEGASVANTGITQSGGKRKNAEELKQALLSFFDDKFAPTSPNRRVMSSRVYNRKAESDFEEELKKPGVLSTFGDMRHLKQFLSSWPVAPYHWQHQQVDSQPAQDSTDR